MQHLDMKQPAMLRWYSIPSDDRIDRGFSMAFGSVDQAIHFYHDKLTAEQRAFASLSTAGRHLTHHDIDALNSDPV